MKKKIVYFLNNNNNKITIKTIFDKGVNDMCKKNQYTRGLCDVFCEFTIKLYAIYGQPTNA